MHATLQSLKTGKIKHTQHQTSVKKQTEQQCGDCLVVMETRECPVR